MIELPKPAKFGARGAAAVDALKYLVKMPYRAFRRAGIERRLPQLPEGRGWRTAISAALQISIMRGLSDYRYREILMLKHPFEIALYTRLIWETKPRTVFEIGTKAGGTALWISDQLRTFGIDGQVISIDIEPPERPPSMPASVTLLRGDANNLAQTLTTNILAALSRPWLVIEDASHHYAATLAVLRFFDPLLRSGEYIVIEDANVTEMGLDAHFNGGPARAIAEFLQDRSRNYIIDASYCDQYGGNVTGNPNGYLRKLLTS
jgi:cephalosporin hydroxylase